MLACTLGLSACGAPAARTAIAQPVQHPVALQMPASITATDAGAPPAFDRDFPDPSVITASHVYYAFATHTPWETPGHVFPVLESSDLTTWSYAADVFSAPPAWGRGDWWAPAVVARGGTYFLYYSGLNPAGSVAAHRRWAGVSLLLRRRTPAPQHLGPAA